MCTGKTSRYTKTGSPALTLKNKTKSKNKLLQCFSVMLWCRWQRIEEESSTLDLLYTSRPLRIDCFPSQTNIKQISNKYQTNIKQISNKYQTNTKQSNAWAESSTVDLLYTKAAFLESVAFPLLNLPISFPNIPNISISISLTSTTPKKSLGKVPFFSHKSQIPPDFVAAGKRRQNTTNVGVRMCLLCFLCP